MMRRLVSVALAIGLFSIPAWGAPDSAGTGFGIERTYNGRFRLVGGPDCRKVEAQVRALIE